MINTDDLTLLNVVKQSAPKQCVGSDGVCYVFVNTIPEGVLDEFEALSPPVRYVEIGSTWCLSLGQWISCKDRLIIKLATQMRKRSLLLGLEGPSSDDIRQAPTLSPWIAISDVQCGGVILVGMQTGHPTISGALINSSRVCGMAHDLSWARTFSRWYRLDAMVYRETLIEALGNRLAGLKHLTLQPSEIQAAISADQLHYGVRDV